MQAAIARGGRGAGAGAGAARVLRAGPRDCASADGSSTAPTTACRSRAWWSCRGSRRRPRARRAAGGASAGAGVSSVAAVPSGTGTPLVAILSLMVIGTPSSAPCGSPCRQRASDRLARRQRAFRVEPVGRLQMRLPSRDAVEDGADHLDRRKRLCAISREEVEGGQVVKRHEGKARNSRSRSRGSRRPAGASSCHGGRRAAT